MSDTISILMLDHGLKTEHASICKSCKWVATIRNGEKVVCYECHLNAPCGSKHAGFPEVREMDWCSHWECHMTGRRLDSDPNVARSRMGLGNE